MFKSYYFWPVFSVVWITAIIFFLVLIQFNGLYGQDSYEYLRYSNALGNFFQTGETSGDYFWPVGYPLTGAIFFWVNNKAWILQGISLLSTLLTAYYIFRILKNVYEPENNKISIVYVILLFVLSPYIFRASVLVMSDMLAVLCIVLSVHHYIKYYQVKENWHLIAMVFFSFCAFMTRYAAAVVLLPVLLHVVWLFLSRFNSKVLVFILLAAILPCIPHILIRAENTASFVHHEWLNTWSLINLFKTDFNTAGGEYHYTLINMVYGFYSVVHPGFIFSGVILVCFLRKDDFQVVTNKVMIFAVVLYAVFIAGISYQNPRFLLLSFPFIIILFYPAYERMMNKFSKYYKVIVAGIVIVQLLLMARAFIPFYNYNKNDQRIAVAVASYPHPTIYTHGLEGPLRAYLSERNVYGMSMDTLYNINKPCLIIIDERHLRDAEKYGAFRYNWNIVSVYRPVKIGMIKNELSIYEIR